mmetsp:Transcript_22396/g.35933  ORF Transcript_22396/g.35933 Transcript_22396/m.35933 type:complete len:206 (+) Transcript_22396:109-726(+)|eukprot:CAMPEP_0202696784 /NCGR_PEP_ID=MMETSP1385-20130828/10108_1 /ASSEMBLY_ACC=CAM_ASM_000861 /TAXON_ID=933848 /ORGANISM="Elphidium margaritaceum" /LENGTH=205 /DNA_ID=CAMNT_0049353065 /DNA_START=76 /DNA_END=693 /DNA_ORIENTATION=+
MTAKRSVLQFLQKRCFQARPQKIPFPPPVPMKTQFNLSHIEPIKNYELAVSDSGDNFEKHNSLYQHYQVGECYVTHSFVDFERFFGGCYGEYWPSHFGGGYHKFLRRRSDEPAQYNAKYPWRNWIRRKCDERGIHWDFPRGQDYHIIARWLLSIYMIVFVARQYGNYKAHRANAKPLEPEDDYPLRFNLPFYVYIIHEQSAPNFE